MNIKCYPVCECGYIFKELTSYTRLVKVSENHSKEVRYFNPSFCPKCKKEIRTISLPREYGGRIEFKKDRRRQL